MRSGALIRQARRAKNWTQGDLADALGVSQQLVSGWEREETLVLPAHIDSVVDVLGLDRVALLEAVLTAAVARTREQAADQGAYTTLARKVAKLTEQTTTLQSKLDGLERLLTQMTATIEALSSKARR